MARTGRPSTGCRCGSIRICPAFAWYPARIFHNDGTEQVPDGYGKMGLNYVLLRNQEWNQVVWEIANLSRDKVTGVEFSTAAGQRARSSQRRFDIDKLELQKVNADHYEGWNVAPGEIAFSHSGYQTGAPKKAIASDLDARRVPAHQGRTGVPALVKGR